MYKFCIRSLKFMMLIIILCADYTQNTLKIMKNLYVLFKIKKNSERGTQGGSTGGSNILNKR